jgi:ABC-2 type transport system permease protein
MSVPTAALELPASRSTGSRNPLRLVGHDMRYGLKVLTRSPFPMLVGLFFPLFFNVMFNVIKSGQVVGGVLNVQFTTAAVIVYVLTFSGYFNLAIGVVVAREKGVLKRIRQTPVNRLVHVASRVLVATTISAVSVALMLVCSLGLFDLHLDVAKLPTLLVAFLLGSYTSCMLGMAVTRLIPTVEAGLVVASATLFPLLFLSGVFFPLTGLPTAVETILDLLPIAPMGDMVLAVFDPSVAAPALDLRDAAVLAVWAVLGTALTLKVMPWQPQR